MAYKRDTYYNPENFDIVYAKIQVGKVKHLTSKNAAFDEPGTFIFKWHWRIIDPDNNIIVNSPTGFSTRTACLANLFNTYRMFAAGKVHSLMINLGFSLKDFKNRPKTEEYYQRKVTLDE